MGIFQILALIPGTSRSGATIIGAIVFGMSRLVASEFSFFLAIPTILGANVLKLTKLAFNLTLFEWQVLIVGSLSAFIVSMYSIRFLFNYIKNHNFKIFGYYRIILGIVILIYFGIKILF
jgi:undecaprenyl-diphosphatase